MINGLKRQEPSIDEMLASIRQIIENGDKGQADKRSVAPSIAPRPSRYPGGTSSEADPVLVAANLDPSHDRGVEHGHSIDAVRSPDNFLSTALDEPLWPDAPGEPANDLTHSGRESDGLTEALRGSTSAFDPEQRPLDLTNINHARDSDASSSAHEDGTEDSIVSAKHRAMSLLSSARPNGDRENVTDHPAACEPASPLEMDEDNSRWADDQPEASRDHEMGSSSLSTAASPERIDFFADFDEETFAAEILGSAAIADHEDPSAPTGVDDGDAFHGELQHGSAEDAERVQAISEAAIHALVTREAGSRIAACFDDLDRVVRNEHLSRLDGTVREMLRPMLEDWLDDNLPRLVERLVREEIERVARGPRR